MANQIIIKKDVKVIKPEKSKFKLSKRNFYYIIDIGLVSILSLLFITGILKLLNVYGDFSYPNEVFVNISIVHNWSGLILGIFATLHTLLHLKWFGQKIKKIFQRTRNFKPKHFGKRGQRILTLFLNVMLAISLVILLITGILKIPGVLAQLGLYPHYSYSITLLHDWNGFIFGLLVFTHFILHWKWFTAVTRKIWTKLKYGRFIMVLSVILVLAFPMVPMVLNVLSPEDPKTGGISIQSVGRFYFSTEDIETIRPDIFTNGHFSIFDILVHLDKIGEIHMQYHFRADLNTYVIDSLNGVQSWWYYAYYDGGWNEQNVYRIDHYPFKPKMMIILFQKPVGMQDIYNTYIQEQNRLKKNSGGIIIPDVYIVSPSSSLLFHNITVTAHNLRNDVFQDGVITAIDVILSMGDQGLLTYELKWYDSIGSAETRSYWVHSINGTESYGRCGFVYEEGDNDFILKENHIHIPSDIRILNSPEYLVYFWVCV